MRGQNNNGNAGAIPFAHLDEQADPSNTQPDEAGQAHLALLGRAADIAIQVGTVHSERDTI
jgi:hypothetical protein